MQIIQLVNGYSKGDGVGNVITAIDQLLHHQGFKSKILNQTLNLADIDSPDLQEDTVLLYHVALSVDPLVCYLRCRKILVFHNITDPALLLGSGLKEMRTWCSAGLYDIRGIKDYFDSAIVFSQYSKKTLIESGWDETIIYEMPIMVRFDNLSLVHDEKVIEKYSDDYTNIIFTGRIFPNKKQDEIITAFSEYKNTYNDKSRLFIVGSIGNENYYKSLINLVKELCLERDVVFTGRAPFAEYLAYYKLADIFLCLSAHEGFCIPIVEALYFKIPIIAANSTAVPDTLGGSGVLANNRNPIEIAKIINHIVTDDLFRKEVLKGEAQRLNELQPDKVEKQYMRVLCTCIENDSISIKFKQLKIRRDLFDNIIIPNKIYEGKNVIYGFGAAGNRLCDYLIHQNINVDAICDQKKGGEIINGISILSPMQVFQMHRDYNYVISVQDKKNLKSIMSLLIENGVTVDNIFVFDEINDVIV